ncbi:hypothetical protein WR25_06403 [Diploscapter pachys]|uniref:Lipid-binding serum glycoprotein C-terminal domain-containing protein n=1 Tax=Diploscapter pachys TaxID=2018661 RepID=A0A2A2LYV7_9BILA|nr:hypothetical protein WR25_06403 [Diploscapter pachys]
MASFRQPSVVTFGPAPPNLFAIKVSDFDFYITGQLTGNIQIIIQIPIAGSVHISGNGVSVTAYADLQKTLDDSPYLRFVQCHIDDGTIDARVGDMGLLTDTVNNKYKHLMSTQSKLQMETAICDHMNLLTQRHFSARLSKIPKSISVKDIISMMLAGRSTKAQFGLPPEQVGPKRARARVWKRHKRAARNDDYYDDVAAIEGTPATTITPPRKFMHYTANSLLYQAHKTNSLLFHIDSHTPGIGKLLKTTCSVDEVCLSDQIEEIGKTYPGRSLELIIRTTQAPVVNISQDTATLQFSGRCLFFIEGTRQKIGVIPFTAKIHMQMRTVGGVLKGSMTIPYFALTDGVDFFGLTARQLEGLRRSTQIGLETFINANLADGIPLQTQHMK